MKPNKCIPALPVQDIGKAVACYAQQLGFLWDVQKEDFARMVRDDVAIDLWLVCDQSWKIRPASPQCWPVVSGAESFLAGTESCRIEVRGVHELFAEYKKSGVLYGPDTSVELTPWGTHGFPALDLERNPVSFYKES